MEASDVLFAAAFGLAGGLLGGIVGVGGGILFVPALVIFLDSSQVEAEATSLLAIIIVAAAGAWRQHGYGNVRLGDAAWIGALSLGGAAVGVVVANAVSERTLEVAFAGLAVVMAAQLIHRARQTRPDG
jgi:uncharacterized membrane protein YfcA